MPPIEHLTTASTDAAGTIEGGGGAGDAAGGSANEPPEDWRGALLEVMRSERLMADPSGRLLAGGLPATWLGAAVEVHDLPVAASATVSFALRWHGARPAVLSTE